MASKANVNLGGLSFQGPAFWSVPLNILFVIDGRINTSKDPTSFGLGYVLETLRTPDWWARMNIKVVRRDKGVLVFPGGVAPVGDTNYNADGSPPTLEFKFTEEYLAAWDQVWLFGDFPANQSNDHLEERFYPVKEQELTCLARWMDRGGGVFAAGDHWNLGASMCWRIPRVRSMRRWTIGQGVPSFDGDDRHQTLQPNPDTTSDDRKEGDIYPQPIEVARSQMTASDLDRPWYPHALLATPTGVIDTFPDHMHEGDIIPDDEVELDNPLHIHGYEKSEYPFAEQTIQPSSSARVVPPIGLPRPRPHVIAYGRTTNPAPPLVSAAVAGDVGTSPGFTKRFGLIGAYDGDSAGIGRVVVESTWHHWFSFNLHGFVAEDPSTQYGLMQTYYRNMVVWLATPAQRQSMLSSLTWRAVVSDTMAFPLVPANSIWAAGKRALGSISQVLSRPMICDWVSSMFAGRAGSIFGVPSKLDSAAPFAESVPIDLALRAIVGGIATSFVKPAYDYLGGGPRPLLNPEAIARGIADGVKLGHRTLVDEMNSRAAASKAVVGQLKGTFKPSSPPVPIALLPLRLTVEGLQFPDPTDPALVSARISLTLRVTLGHSVVVNEVIHLEVPPFLPTGGLTRLDRLLYNGVAQSGEALVVEIYARDAKPGLVEAERLRFSDTLTGNPSDWVGEHAPNRSQSWRLWYRIESAR